MNKVKEFVQERKVITILCAAIIVIVTICAIAFALKDDKKRTASSGEIVATGSQVAKGKKGKDTKASGKINSKDEKSSDDVKSEEETTELPETIEILSDTNVRDGASGDSEKVGTLNAGQSVKVLAKEGEWYKVEVDGKEEYVHESTVKKPASSTQSTTAGGNSQPAPTQPQTQAPTPAPTQSQTQAPTPAPQPQTEAPTQAPVQEHHYWDEVGYKPEFEAQFRQKYDEYVRNNGVYFRQSPHWNDDLYKVAYARAKEIATVEYSHTSYAGYKNGYSVNECIASAPSDPSAAAGVLVEGLLESEGHRAILLNSDDTEHAVAVYQNKGKVYAVFISGSPTGYSWESYINACRDYCYEDYGEDWDNNFNLQFQYDTKESYIKAMIEEERQQYIRKHGVPVV